MVDTAAARVYATARVRGRQGDSGNGGEETRGGTRDRTGSKKDNKKKSVRGRERRKRDIEEERSKKN